MGKALEITQCSVVGMVNKHCPSVKHSLSTVRDAFVCKVCKTADDGENIKIQEGKDLVNDLCLL